MLAQIDVAYVECSFVEFYRGQALADEVIEAFFAPRIAARRRLLGGPRRGGPLPAGGPAVPAACMTWGLVPCRAMSPAQADFCSGLPAGARILVTGGSGFIGTNLVGAYRAAGLTVRNADVAKPRSAADSDLGPVSTSLESPSFGKSSRKFVRPMSSTSPRAPTSTGGRYRTTPPTRQAWATSLPSWPRRRIPWSAR